MSIKPEFLIARMEWAARNNLSEFAFSADGATVRIKRETGSENGVSSSAATPDAHPAQPLADGPSGIGIEAPLSGLVYFSQQAGLPPFVKVGDEVKAGQTVCLIEAMKVMTSVTAEADGIVEEICVVDGSSVEAGTLLIEVRA